jgi:hypothetical protein
VTCTASYCYTHMSHNASQSVKGRTLPGSEGERSTRVGGCGQTTRLEKDAFWGVRVMRMHARTRLDLTHLCRQSLITPMIVRARCRSRCSGGRNVLSRRESHVHESWDLGPYDRTCFRSGARDDVECGCQPRTECFKHKVPTFVLKCIIPLSYVLRSPTKQTNWTDDRAGSAFCARVG